jgi:hypothetical protein
MRFVFLAALALTACLLCGGPAAAQTAPRVTIDRIEVGFRSPLPEDSPGRFKAGLWAPVYVTLRGGAEALTDAELLVETTDSDDVKNVYPTPLSLKPAEERTVLTYVRPGIRGPNVRVSVRSGGRELAALARSFLAPELDSHLYLVLFGTPEDLEKALAVNADTKEVQTRWAAHEADVARLPDRSFGYDAVDLVLLSAGDGKQLDRLLADKERVQALAGWVRRGGRLVVSLSAEQQGRLQKLFDAWQPPLPDLVTPGKHEEFETLPSVRAWARVQGGKRFPAAGSPPVRLAALRGGPGADVQASEEEAPLIVRRPCGLGSVTLLAFDLGERPFRAWAGKEDFWKALVAKLGPRISGAQAEEAPRTTSGDPEVLDVGARLQRDLDRFDVPRVSFGLVALFIFLYILLVGPLDYLLLKNVFKRLEWTWVTFPLVVVAVTVAAYFSAAALGGKDQEINQVDLVDIDLRGAAPHAYGTTWFTVWSPDLRTVTAGVEPAWGVLAPGNAPVPAVVTWFGRPEAAGPGSLGRLGAQSRFRWTYQYAPNAAGLRGVPIPARATRAFTASWEAPLRTGVVAADLTYPPDSPEDLAGTIRSGLPGPLLDAGLFYGGKWRPLDRLGPEAPTAVVLEPRKAQSVDQWARAAGKPAGDSAVADKAPLAVRDPTAALLPLLFHEKSDLEYRRHNHAWRLADWSWRVRDDLRPREAPVREAILFGRFRRVAGPAKESAAAGAATLPTRLWLGALPGDGQPRPDLTGTLVQDTYVRVILPVYPKAAPKDRQP